MLQSERWQKMASGFAALQERWVSGMRGSIWRSLSTLLLILLVTGPLLFSPGNYVLRILILSFIYFVFALGYNLVITVGGLFHLGMAAHFALGAYVGGLLMVRLGWGTPEALCVVILVSAIFTFLMALPTLQFIGDYLSVITLAVAEILRLIIINWKSLTNGPLGLPGIPPPTFLGHTSLSQGYLFFCLGISAIVALWAYHKITASRYGLLWEGIRLNPDAVQACGFRLKPHKLAILIVGSIFAGVAGMGYANFAGIVSPTLASLDVTIVALSIVILGGGTSLGLLIASIVLTSLPQAFLGLEIYRQLALGLVLIIVMNWRPEGFSLGAKRGYARLKERESPKSITFEVGKRPTNVESQTAPALEAKALSKSFGGLRAVDDLTVSVPPGAIYGIIGPNGAGKTTVFNLVTGVYKPDKGRICIHGQDVTGEPVWQIARLGVGRTFQTIKLFGRLTALDNVLLGAAQEAIARPMSKATWEETIDRASNALYFVGLGHKAETAAGSLPYADQRRLEIARALAGKPRLLLLDEPSAGMNPRELDTLRELVSDLRHRGITIICIEHNMRFILPLADEIVVMAEGKHLFAGKPNVVQDNPAVIEAYLGRRVARVELVS